MTSFPNPWTTQDLTSMGISTRAQRDFLDTINILSGSATCARVVSESHANPVASTSLSGNNVAKSERVVPSTVPSSGRSHATRTGSDFPTSTQK
jgi:hypothetical protein